MDGVIIHPPHPHPPNGVGRPQWYDPPATVDEQSETMALLATAISEISARVRRQLVCSVGGRWKSWHVPFSNGCVGGSGR